MENVKKGGSDDSIIEVIMGGLRKVRIAYLLAWLRLRNVASRRLPSRGSRLSRLGPRRKIH